LDRVINKFIDTIFGQLINFNFLGQIKIESRGQFVNFKYLRDQIKKNENLRTKMQKLKNFENSSNYYPNNGIYLKVFEFPQNIHHPNSKTQKVFINKREC